MSNIDSIVNVQISIEAPMNTSASFSALLLVVPKAENSGSITMPDVAEISGAADLSEFGYTEESKTESQKFVLLRLVFFVREIIFAAFNISKLYYAIQA